MFFFDIFRQSFAFLKQERLPAKGHDLDRHKPLIAAFGPSMALKNVQPALWIIDTFSLLEELHDFLVESVLAPSAATMD